MNELLFLLTREVREARRVRAAERKSSTLPERLPRSSLSIALYTVHKVHRLY